MKNAALTARDPDRDKIRSSHPAPWSVEEKATFFVVRDHNGQALSRVYLKGFTRDEARHLAAAFAKLPELWRNDKY